MESNDFDTWYQAGQMVGRQDLILEIKRKVSEIEKNSKGSDILFDILKLLKELK
jgi:hypothetical protein